ncbi:unnamed protein product [Urochloa humidicola]
MADSVEKKLGVGAPLLPPVAVEKKKKEEEKKAPLLPAVQLVCQWALHTAAIFFFSMAFTIANSHYNLTATALSWLSLCACAEGDLTGVEEMTIPIMPGFLWCSAASAAAAALALLLPERLRRSRRALAYVALAAAAAAHLMFARVLTLFFTAKPRGIFWWIFYTAGVAILADGNIKCFPALLGKGAHANAPALLLMMASA